HLFSEYQHKLVKEGLFEAEECKTITNRSAKNTSDNVTSTGIRGKLTIGNGKSNCANVIGHHAHGDVSLFVGTVSDARFTADEIKQRSKHIGIVVRRLLLNCHAETFESHSCIDVALG